MAFKLEATKLSKEESVINVRDSHDICLSNIPRGLIITLALICCQGCSPLIRTLNPGLHDELFNSEPSSKYSPAFDSLNKEIQRAEREHQQKLEQQTLDEKQSLKDAQIEASKAAERAVLKKAGKCAEVNKICYTKPEMERKCHAYRKFLETYGVMVRLFAYNGLTDSERSYLYSFVPREIYNAPRVVDDEFIHLYAPDITDDIYMIALTEKNIDFNNLEMKCQNAEFYFNL